MNGMRLVELVVVIALGFGGVSCQLMKHQPMSAGEINQRSAGLKAALLELPGVDENDGNVAREAEEIARICVVEGERFALENGAVRPSWWNNCLVNVGLRRWGLCWHYQHYLYGKLLPLDLNDFVVHCGARDKGRLFHEHNCIVIVPSGGDFHEGLVIDPWEDSGRTIWFRTRGEHGEWIDQPKWVDWLDKQLTKAGKSEQAN